MTEKKRHNGFTLVEVLLAMAIFAVAITTIFAAFNTVISSINPMNTRIDDYEMAQTAMDRIQKDLLSLCLTHNPVYSPPNMEDTDKKDRFRFVSQTISFEPYVFSHLRFASFEHLSFKTESKGAIGIITYYVELLDTGDLVLKRSDVNSVFFDEKTETNTAFDPVLCTRITAFKFNFIDEQGKEYELWDSDAPDFGYATPFAIKISLSIGDDEKSQFFSTTLVLPTFREKNDA